MIEQLPATERNILVGSSNLVHSKQFAVLPLQLTVDIRDIVIYVEGRGNKDAIRPPAISKNEVRYLLLDTSF